MYAKARIVSVFQSLDLRTRLVLGMYICRKPKQFWYKTTYILYCIKNKAAFQT